MRTYSCKVEYISLVCPSRHACLFQLVGRCRRARVLDVTKMHLRVAVVQTCLISVACAVQHGFMVHEHYDCSVSRKLTMLSDQYTFLHQACCLLC